MNCVNSVGIVARVSVSRPRYFYLAYLGLADILGCVQLRKLS